MRRSKYDKYIKLINGKGFITKRQVEGLINQCPNAITYIEMKEEKLKELKELREILCNLRGKTWEGYLYETVYKI